MQSIGVIVALIVGLALCLGAGLYLSWRFRYRNPPPSPPPVLCFHKISRRFLWEGTWTTPSRFFAIIDRLRGRGYRFVGEDEYLSALDDDAGGDRRALFLTFDDGYAGLQGEVLDGLVRRSVPLHVFLVSDFAGETNRWDLSLGRRPSRHASWEEVRDMAATGVTFGSHTATHPDLTRMDAQGLADEVGGSKRAIEDAVGARVRTLSYPFGRYDDAARAAVRAAGYEAAFSLYPRHGNEHVDRFALRRNGVYIIDTPRVVEAKIAPGRWFWFEEMKCRTINAVAILTPLIKNRRRYRDTTPRSGRGSSIGR